MERKLKDKFDQFLEKWLHIHIHLFETKYFEVRGTRKFGRKCLKCSKKQVFIKELEDFIWVDLDIFKKYYKPLYKCSTAEVMARYT